LISCRSHKATIILPVQVNAFQTATVAHSEFAARAVDENASHRLRRGGKEVGAVFKGRVTVAHQPKPFH
jgi:hypothetical protein